MGGHVAAEVIAQFLKDVEQRRGDRNTPRNAKTKAVRLSRAMVGVLPHDDDADLVKGRFLEGVKDQVAWRIDGLRRCPLCGEEGRQLSDVGLGKLLFQGFHPGGFQGKWGG